jgi:hypothetical protein
MSETGPSEVQVLNIIGRAQSMIARLEVMGVDPAPARTLLQDARESLKKGGNTIAVEYAKQSITEIVRLKKMADKGGGGSAASPAGIGGGTAAGPAPAPAPGAPAAGGVVPKAIPLSPRGAAPAGPGTAGGGGSGSGAVSRGTVKDDIPELKEGYSYVMEEDRPKRCYHTITSLMEKGYKAYCVTRRNPRMVAGEFGLEDARLVWLTESQPDEMDYIEPSLESLLYRMEIFVDENEKPVLFLDGIEYLASKTSFEAVMSFVRRLVDMVSDRGVIFLTVVSPEALGEKQTKSLEREVTAV